MSCATMDSINFSNGIDSGVICEPLPRLPVAVVLNAAAYLVEIVKDVSFFIRVSHSALTLSHFGISTPMDLTASSVVIPEASFAFTPAHCSSEIPSKGSKIEFAIIIF